MLSKTFEDVEVWQKAHKFVLEECRYYLILVRDLNYGDVSQLKVDLGRISKMLDAYMRAIRNVK